MKHIILLLASHKIKAQRNRSVCVEATYGNQIKTWKSRKSFLIKDKNENGVNSFHHQVLMVSASHAYIFSVAFNSNDVKHGPVYHLVMWPACLYSASTHRSVKSQQTDSLCGSEHGCHGNQNGGRHSRDMVTICFWEQVRLWVTFRLAVLFSRKKWFLFDHLFAMLINIM